MYDLNGGIFCTGFFTEDWLLVGTKPGHLLLYRIKKDPGKENQRGVVPCVFVDLLNIPLPVSKKHLSNSDEYILFALRQQPV